MGTKKKLGLGLVTGALGLALVGGGTFAAFNDIEVLENSFAAGTLDLVVAGETTHFALENLKPGDSMTREFELLNNGSLAIKEVLLHASAHSHHVELSNDSNIAQLQAGADLDGFLKQFQIEVMRIDEGMGEQYEGQPITEQRLFNLIQPEDEFTLYDLVHGNFSKLDGIAPFLVESDGDGNPLFTGDRLNLAPNRTATDPSTGSDIEWDGVPVDPADSSTVQITIKFIEDDERDDNGYFKQNAYQGNSMHIDFYLEATQWHGIDVGSNNGYVHENEKANPEDQE